MNTPTRKADELLAEIDAIISDNVYVDNDGVAGISSAAESILALLPRSQSDATTASERGTRTNQSPDVDPNLFTAPPEATSVREALIEECAKIAASHKGSARKQREGRGKKYYGSEALEEILAEERGEDIASEMIAKAIRAALQQPVRETGKLPADWEQDKAETSRIAPKTDRGEFNLVNGQFKNADDGA